MAKFQKIEHSTIKCKGVGYFEVKFDESNTPFLECSNCNKVIDDWIRWKNIYSSYWSIKDKWESKKDHLMCLLSYFSELYKRHYGLDFTFSLNERGLFNGKEVFCIRKMYSMLGNDAIQSKEYIDWVFANKVIKRNKKITSLSFLAVPEIIQEFKLQKQKSRKITRNRALPDKMISWIAENSPDILNHVSLRDFGELRMALSAYKDGHLSHIDGLEHFIDKLKANKIIDNDANIIGWSE